MNSCRMPLHEVTSPLCTILSGATNDVAGVPGPMSAVGVLQEGSQVVEDEFVPRLFRSSPTASPGGGDRVSPGRKAETVVWHSSNVPQPAQSVATDKVLKFWLV